MVLAVDLLNPSPAAEARKHKLKVRFFVLLSFSISSVPLRFSPLRSVFRWLLFVFVVCVCVWVWVWHCDVVGLRGVVDLQGVCVGWDGMDE